MKEIKTDNKKGNSGKFFKLFMVFLIFSLNLYAFYCILNNHNEVVSSREDIANIYIQGDYDLEIALNPNDSITIFLDGDIDSPRHVELYIISNSSQILQFFEFYLKIEEPYDSPAYAYYENAEKTFINPSNDLESYILSVKVQGSGRYRMQVIRNRGNLHFLYLILGVSLWILLWIFAIIAAKKTEKLSDEELSLKNFFTMGENNPIKKKFYIFIWIEVFTWIIINAVFLYQEFGIFADPEELIAIQEEGYIVLICGVPFLCILLLLLFVLIETSWLKFNVKREKKKRIKIFLILFILLLIFLTVLFIYVILDEHFDYNVDIRPITVMLLIILSLIGYGLIGIDIAVKIKAGEIPNNSYYKSSVSKNLKKQENTKKVENPIKLPILLENDKEQPITEECAGKVCDNCNAKFREQALFCHKCGKSIHSKIRFCGYCGIQIEKGDSFCYKCGNILELIGVSKKDQLEFKKRVSSKICPLCGNDKENDGKYCPECGNRFESFDNVEIKELRI